MKTNKEKLKHKLNEKDLIIEYKNKEKNNGNESIQQQIKQKKIKNQRECTYLPANFSVRLKQPNFPSSCHLLAISICSSLPDKIKNNYWFRLFE